VRLARKIQGEFSFDPFRTEPLVQLRLLACHRERPTSTDCSATGHQCCEGFIRG
jgi:hypothetical protein